MGETKKSKKVIRITGHLPYGGDPYVNLRTGISTENHMQLFARLIKDGPRMHGTPGERKPKRG